MSFFVSGDLVIYRSIASYRGDVFIFLEKTSEIHSRVLGALGTTFFLTNRLQKLEEFERAGELVKKLAR